MGGWWCKDDPGPCPVDDTPHTACTPESVLQQSLRMRQTVVVPIRPPRIFTTATYRRALHAPGARAVAPVSVAAVTAAAIAPTKTKTTKKEQPADTVRRAMKAIDRPLVQTDDDDEDDA